MLPHRKILYRKINKCRRNEGNTKASSGKDHSNNCCRLNPPADAKISGWKSYEKQNTGIVPKVCINYKGKKCNFTVERPSREHLNQTARLASLIITHRDIMWHWTTPAKMNNLNLLVRKDYTNSQKHLTKSFTSMHQMGQDNEM